MVCCVTVHADYTPQLLGCAAHWCSEHQHCCHLLWHHLAERQQLDLVQSQLVVLVHQLLAWHEEL